MIGIDKISCKFIAKNEIFAYNLYANWDDFCHYYIETAINDVLLLFNKNSFGINIEKLNLNIGIIPEDQFFQIFPIRLKEELERALSSIKDPNESLNTIEQQRCRLSNLIFYLINGFCKDLWFDSSFYFQTELANLIQEKPEDIAEMIQYSLKNLTFERILLQLDKDFIFKIIKAWFDTSHYSFNEKQNAFSYFINERPYHLFDLIKKSTPESPTFSKLINLLDWTKIHDLPISLLYYLQSENLRQTIDRLPIKDQPKWFMEENPEWQWLFDKKLQLNVKKRYLTAFLENDMSRMINLICTAKDIEFLNSLAEILDEITVQQIIIRVCERKEKSELADYWFYTYEWLQANHIFFIEEPNLVINNPIHKQINLALLQLIRKNIESFQISKTIITSSLLKESFGLGYYPKILFSIYKFQSKETNKNHAKINLIFSELYFTSLQLYLGIDRLTNKYTLKQDNTKNKSDMKDKDHYEFISDAEHFINWLKNTAIPTKIKQNFLSYLSSKQPIQFIWIIKNLYHHTELPSLLAKIMDTHAIKRIITYDSIYKTEIIAQITNLISKIHQIKKTNNNDTLTYLFKKGTLQVLNPDISPEVAPKELIKLYVDTIWNFNSSKVIPSGKNLILKKYPEEIISALLKDLSCQNEIEYDNQQTNIIDYLRSVLHHQSTSNYQKRRIISRFMENHSTDFFTVIQLIQENELLEPLVDVMDELMYDKLILLILQKTEQEKINDLLFLCHWLKSHQFPTSIEGESNQHEFSYEVIKSIIKISRNYDPSNSWQIISMQFLFELYQTKYKENIECIYKKILEECCSAKKKFSTFKLRKVLSLLAQTKNKLATEDEYIFPFSQKQITTFLSDSENTNFHAISSSNQNKISGKPFEEDYEKSNTGYSEWQFNPAISSKHKQAIFKQYATFRPNVALDILQNSFTTQRQEYTVLLNISTALRLLSSVSLSQSELLQQIIETISIDSNTFIYKTFNPDGLQSAIQESLEMLLEQNNVTELASWNTKETIARFLFSLSQISEKKQKRIIDTQMYNQFMEEDIKEIQLRLHLSNILQTFTNITNQAELQSSESLHNPDVESSANWWQIISDPKITSFGKRRYIAYLLENTPEEVIYLIKKSQDKSKLRLLIQVLDPILLNQIMDIYFKKENETQFIYINQLLSWITAHLDNLKWDKLLFKERLTKVILEFIQSEPKPSQTKQEIFTYFLKRVGGNENDIKSLKDIATILKDEMKEEQTDYISSTGYYLFFLINDLLNQTESLEKESKIITYFPEKGTSQSTIHQLHPNAPVYHKQLTELLDNHIIPVNNKRLLINQYIQLHPDRLLSLIKSPETSPKILTKLSKLLTIQTIVHWTSSISLSEAEFIQQIIFTLKKLDIPEDKNSKTTLFSTTNIRKILILYLKNQEISTSYHSPNNDKTKINRLINLAFQNRKKKHIYKKGKAFLSPAKRELSWEICRKLGKRLSTEDPSLQKKILIIDPSDKPFSQNDKSINGIIEIILNNRINLYVRRRFLAASLEATPNEVITEVQSIHSNEQLHIFAQIIDDILLNRLTDFALFHEKSSIEYIKQLTNWLLSHHRELHLSERVIRKKLSLIILEFIRQKQSPNKQDISIQLLTRIYEKEEIDNELSRIFRILEKSIEHGMVPHPSFFEMDLFIDITAALSVSKKQKKASTTEIAPLENYEVKNNPIDPKNKQKNNYPGNYFAECLDLNIPIHIRQQILEQQISLQPKQLIHFIRSFGKDATLLDKLVDLFDEKHLLRLTGAVSLTKAELLQQIILSLKKEISVKKITSKEIRKAILIYLQENELDFYSSLENEKTVKKFIMVLLKMRSEKTIQTKNETANEISQEKTIEKILQDLSIDIRMEDEKHQHLLIPEYILIYNAGLVLLSPWFPKLFSMLGLLNEDKKEFKDIESKIKAIFVIQRLVSSEDKEYREQDLAFNRLLVNCPFSQPLPRKMELNAETISTIDSMLSGVKANWPQMKNTSIAGFQRSFIQRNGNIENQEEKTILTVETKAFDTLLDSLPWSYKLIRFPWLKRHIHVTWR